MERLLLRYLRVAKSPLPLRNPDIFSLLLYVSSQLATMSRNSSRLIPKKYIEDGTLQKDGQCKVICTFSLFCILVARLAFSPGCPLTGESQSSSHSCRKLSSETQFAGARCCTTIKTGTEYERSVNDLRLCAVLLVLKRKTTS
ncbi:hypothetical protein BJX61DRAFT_191860 [Aspergillus egyptiacus]|nr:hypothetical protein BJX61DRAFT_191860 [Aspergillus egyptiacus]